jgi:hypothetical protein
MLKGVLKRAKCIARGMHHSEIGTEHVAIALLESKGIGLFALRNLGVSVTAEALRQEVNDIVYNPERDGPIVYVDGA